MLFRLSVGYSLQKIYLELRDNIISLIYTFLHHSCNLQNLTFFLVRGFSSLDFAQDFGGTRKLPALFLARIWDGLCRGADVV